MLDAGLSLIRRNGLRATSMEEVARVAGVAKPTLYKYFPDKAALYNAIIERLIAELKANFDKTLARNGGAAERIAEALAGLKKYLFRLLQASPHAQELYAEDPDISMEAMLAFERYVENEVGRVLSESGHAQSRYMAQLLMACATGIFKRTQYVEQIGPALRLVTEKLLA